MAILLLLILLCSRYLRMASWRTLIDFNCGLNSHIVLIFLPGLRDKVRRERKTRIKEKEKEKEKEIEIKIDWNLIQA